MKQQNGPTRRSVGCRTVRGRRLHGHQPTPDKGGTWQYALTCAVHMGDREPLERLQTECGGRIYSVSVRGDRRPMWRWALTVRSPAFLNAILPYVAAERVARKIRLALEFQGQKRNTGPKPDPGYLAAQAAFYERQAGSPGTIRRCAWRRSSAEHRGDEALQHPRTGASRERPVSMRENILRGRRLGCRQRSEDALRERPPVRRVRTPGRWPTASTAGRCVRANMRAIGCRETT